MHPDRRLDHAVEFAAVAGGVLGPKSRGDQRKVAAGPLGDPDLDLTVFAPGERFGGGRSSQWLDDLDLDRLMKIAIRVFQQVRRA